jgi:hypothetical protein
MANAVLERLRSHIAMMATHQAERHAGKLLVAAADEIERLLRGEGVLEFVNENEADLEIRYDELSQAWTAHTVKWQGVGDTPSEAIEELAKVLGEE